MVYLLIKEARDTATDKKQQEEMEIDARDTMGVAYAGRFPRWLLHGLTLTSLFPAGFDTVRSFSLSLAWL